MACGSDASTAAAAAADGVPPLARPAGHPVPPTRAPPGTSRHHAHSPSVKASFLSDLWIVFGLILSVALSALSALISVLIVLPFLHPSSSLSPPNPTSTSTSSLVDGHACTPRIIMTCRFGARSRALTSGSGSGIQVLGLTVLKDKDDAWFGLQEVCMLGLTSPKLACRTRVGSAIVDCMTGADTVLRATRGVRCTVLT
eukprot:1150015-Rhodomonas_salina.1